MGELREVYFVDGVRTAFGRAGPKGVFWRTRADDMAVKLVRELLRRNSTLPPEQIDDVVFAATAQVGDQGPDSGELARPAAAADKGGGRRVRGSIAPPARGRVAERRNARGGRADERLHGRRVARGRRRRVPAPRDVGRSAARPAAAV